jgi:hypothetical protein
VLFAFSATLGLGFYLPLQKTHQLLKKELNVAQGTLAQLNESLAKSEAQIKRVTGERTELEGFKSQIDTESQRYPKLAESFGDEAELALQTALGKKTVQAVALDSGLAVAWMNPTLLNWKRTVASPSGEKLLCPALKRAATLGLSEVTVRTFALVDSPTSDVQAAHTTAGALASVLADQLLRMCSVPLASVSVASSPATKESPLVRFEFRAKSAAPSQVGL